MIPVIHMTTNSYTSNTHCIITIFLVSGYTAPDLFAPLSVVLLLPLLSVGVFLVDTKATATSSRAYTRYPVCRSNLEEAHVMDLGSSNREIESGFFFSAYLFGRSGLGLVIASRGHFGL